MASVKDTASFFTHGNSKQFDFVFKLYPQVLKLKAETRTKKPEELIRLDDWYQNELPKRIKQRGKDAHLVHEELVQAMKWKQTRGKFYPQLSYLIKVNTPRAVMQETKKAFRKLPNLEQALTALSNLKGVGTTMASALLAAAAPDSAPFMADECLMAIPEIEGIDYTAKEYLNFVQHIQQTCSRLNTEKDNNNTSWSAHRVELTVWTHYVATQLRPELLEGLPTQTNGSTTTEIETTTPADDSSAEPSSTEEQNNKQSTEDENSTADENSQDLVISTTNPSSLSINSDNSNSTATSQTNNTVADVEAEADAENEPNAVTTSTLNGNASSATEQSDESNLEQPVIVTLNGNSKNGIIDSLDESSSSSVDKTITPVNEISNDSDSQASSNKRSLDCESSESQTAINEASEPETKKHKITAE